MTQSVRVTVIQADGSAPRDVGTLMTVGKEGFAGTIGGGALENAALQMARQMLAENDQTDWPRRVKDYPLGPDLAQCCGGYVRLLYEVLNEQQAAALQENQGIAIRPLASGLPLQIITDRKALAEDWPLALRRAVGDMLSGAAPSRAALVAGDWYVDPLARDLTPLYLYGAGHVGRAVVHALQGLPFRINWVDTDASRFPDSVQGDIKRIIDADPAAVAASAAPESFHVVMTFSHVIDYDICRAVLGRGDFAYLGLIGSNTKRARFAQRLRRQGLGDSRLHSPIGVPGLEGKEPAVIAISLAADILVRLNKEVRAQESGLDAGEGMAS